MSELTTNTPWFFQRRPIQTPYQIWDARANHEISLFQYLILEMFHRRVDWATGTAVSLSAEQIIYDLDNTGLIPEGEGKTRAQRKESRERFVQRQMKSLRTHGWYHDDYQKGSPRPYCIWLYEHPAHDGVGNCTLLRHLLRYEALVADESRQHVAAESSLFVADKSPLTPLVGTSCHPTRAQYVADETVEDVADETAESVGDLSLTLSSNNTDSAFGVGGQSKTSQPPSAVFPTGLPVPQAINVTQLQNALVHIAAAAPRPNTYGNPRWIETERWERVILAYGIESIQQDFAAYMADESIAPTKAPISTYILHAIDARLGSAPKDTPPLPVDPQVEELRSLTYEHLFHVPAVAVVAKALDANTFEDIKRALIIHAESATTTRTRELFWKEGNTPAIVAAIRRQDEAKAAQFIGGKP